MRCVLVILVGSALSCGHEHARTQALSTNFEKSTTSPPLAQVPKRNTAHVASEQKPRNGFGVPVVLSMGLAKQAVLGVLVWWYANSYRNNTE